MHLAGQKAWLSLLKREYKREREREIKKRTENQNKSNVCIWCENLWLWTRELPLCFLQWKSTLPVITPPKKRNPALGETITNMNVCCVLSKFVFGLGRGTEYDLCGNVYGITGGCWWEPGAKIIYSIGDH